MIGRLRILTAQKAENKALNLEMPCSSCFLATMSIVIAAHLSLCFTMSSPILLHHEKKRKRQ